MLSLIVLGARLMQIYWYLAVEMEKSRFGILVAKSYCIHSMSQRMKSNLLNLVTNKLNSSLLLIWMAWLDCMIWWLRRWFQSFNPIRKLLINLCGILCRDQCLLLVVEMVPYVFGTWIHNIRTWLQFRHINKIAWLVISTNMRNRLLLHHQIKA